jgi:hypothetical protein
LREANSTVLDEWSAIEKLTSGLLVTRDRWGVQF